MPITDNKQFKTVPFRVHTQVSLLPDQIDRIETFSTSELELFRYIMGLVEIGCSVTIKPNDRGGFTSAVQAIHPNHKAAGQAVYSNAPTPQESVAVMVFKMETVGPKSDWSLKAEQNTEQKYR